MREKEGLRSLLLRKLSLSAAVVTGVFSIIMPANAQITVSGDVGAGGIATITIGQDLTFSIIRSGVVRNIVFDEWVTSDGGRSQNSFLAGSTLAYERNGTPGTVSLNGINDNQASTGPGAYTPNDGHLFIGNASTITVAEGDTLTLKAGSWDFNGSSSFNPQTVGTFTGNVFLSDGSGNVYSPSIAAVPEPSEYAMMAAVGLLGWGIWRRKRQATVG